MAATSGAQPPPPNNERQDPSLALLLPDDKHNYRRALRKQPRLAHGARLDP